SGAGGGGLVPRLRLEGDRRSRGRDGTQDRARGARERPLRPADHRRYCEPAGGGVLGERQLVPEFPGRIHPPVRGGPGCGGGGHLAGAGGTAGARGDALTSTQRERVSMIELDLWLMTAVIFIPTLFALILLFFPRDAKEGMRWTALLGTALTLVVSLFLYIHF